VPTGGTTGQVLSKTSAADFATTWSTPTGGGGVTDGDKGDIIVSAGGATWLIDAAAVTLAKMANLPASSVIVRQGTTAGVPETIAAGVNGQILTRAADTLTFGALELGNPAAVSGTLGAARGGTGQSAYTKGDLLVGTAGNALVNLGAGTDGTVLHSNSAAAGGIEWQSPCHVLHFAQNTSTTVQNTIAESSLFGTGLGSRTIPAAQLQVGDYLRVRASGYYSTPGSGPGTANHRLRINGTQILQTNQQTLATGVSQLHWHIEVWVMVRVLGVGGQVGPGTLVVFSCGSTSTTLAPRMWSTIGPVSVDLSAGLTVDITIEMNTALATNIWAGTGGTLERMRVMQ
jgi:hypothetical protein